MATGKNIGFTDYCDTVHCELREMKSRLGDLISDIEHMPPKERETLTPHITHLQDIMKMIDWKMEILVRVCPHSWKGFGADVESTVSVESTSEEFAAPGYVGG